LNQLVLCWNRLFTQLVLETERTKKLVIHGISERVSFEMDSHAWSTTWHDTTTNNRGRQLEEYIISKQLNIINEPSTKKTFGKRIGKSNIDITLASCNVQREEYLTGALATRKQFRPQHIIVCQENEQQPHKQPKHGGTKN